MKLDLSVTITQTILDRLAGMTSTNQIPAVDKFGHLGTHFDVMNKQFSLANTVRRGLVFNVSHIRDRDITADDIDTLKILEHDFVIFYSGYLQEHGYGTPSYFANHPQLAQPLITELINKKVSIIGIDFAGIRHPAEHPAADQYCADHDVFVIENLNNIDRLWAATGDRAFTLHTYPVNYDCLTGLPCRVIAEFA